MPEAKWLALSYTVPTSPSKARVYVWRRLRAIGAQPLRNGLAALPNNGESLKSFRELAEKIRALSGEATIIKMDFVDEKESRELQNRFSAASEEQLRGALQECGELLDRLNSADDPQSRSLLERELKRKLKRLGDKASPIQSQAAEIERAAAELVGALKGLPAELSAMLKARK